MSFIHSAILVSFFWQCRKRSVNCCGLDWKSPILCGIPEKQVADTIDTRDQYIFIYNFFKATDIDLIYQIALVLSWLQSYLHVKVQYTLSAECADLDND